MSAPNSGPVASDTSTTEPSSSTGLTFPQIAASALAAATAAILGSFMGVLGTIGGAAAASIISTVGAALYQRSLERTRDRVKQRLVVGGTAQDKVSAVVARATGRSAVPTRAEPAPQVPAQQRPTQAMPPAGRPGVPAPGTRPMTGPVRGGPPPGPGRGGPPARPMPPGQVALRADGTRILADGTQVLADGTRVLADGVTRVQPTTHIPSSRAPMTPAGGGPTAVFGQPGGAWRAWWSRWAR